MRRSDPGSRPVGGPAQDRPLRRDTAAAQGIRKVSSLPVRFTVCPVSFAFVLGALLFPAVHLGAQTSVYPVGGQRGTSFEVQIQNYGCISGVLFCCQHLQARVKDACQALLEVEVDPAAEIGVHLLRLFSPEGVSRPLTLQVVAEPTTVESRAPHQSAREAQPVSIPTVVNGRISHSGELDFYAFEASAGEELQFETVTASGLISGAPHVFNNPHLVLYEPAGSWFDPHRARRLEGRDESVQFFLPYFTGTNVYNTFHKLARLSHRFEKEGWYVIEVSSPHTVENGIPSQIVVAVDVFIPQSGVRGGGSCSNPCRCMRSMATRQLISLRPPSGLNQPKSWQAKRESWARERVGSSPISSHSRRISRPLKSPAAGRAGLRIPAENRAHAWLRFLF